jgi:hypothetical protein
MYDLPDQTPGTSYVISDDVVDGREKLFKLTEPRTKSA